MIEFEDLCLTYSGSHEVFSNITMSLDPGKVYFLTGNSGAGKSSFLKLLYLAIAPTRGKLRIFGNDVESFQDDDKVYLYRRLGIIFQDFRLINHLNVYDNVALPLILSGKTQNLHSDVTEILHWVEMGDKVDVFPRHLSGGEKQRVAIARSVIAKPDLILADEPTGSMDMGMSRKIMYLFMELNKLGHTIIIATHATSLLNSFSCSVLCIEDKKLHFMSRT